MPRLCVRGARGRFGGFGPVPGVVSLSFPPPRPACSALRVAGRLVQVSLTLARWYAIPHGLCVPRARSGCPSGSPRVSLSCVCARAPASSAPLPTGPCPSACPAPVPCSVWRACGEAVRSRFPPTWLGVVGVAVGRPWGGCLLLSPRPACPAGAACRGGGWGPSPGGWPATVVRGPWCQALSLPRPPVLWSGQLGFRGPCVPGAVGAGVGTQHQPHSVCPCGPALLAVEVAEGRPRGGCLPPL